MRGSQCTQCGRAGWRNNVITSVYVDRDKLAICNRARARYNSIVIDALTKLHNLFSLLRHGSFAEFHGKTIGDVEAPDYYAWPAGFVEVA